MILMPSVFAWSNGNSLWNEPTFVDEYMMWQRTNMFGTHDYLAQAALDMLAEQAPEEVEWLNERIYFYGTELPDSRGYAESMNDLVVQYLRFDMDGNLVDDSLAKRSMKKYELLLNSHAVGATGTAAKWSGVIASYISDAGLFTRVIEEKAHGLDYETYMLKLTDIVYPSDEFEDIYGDYIEFDGLLETISPYDAVMKVGAATYMGKKDGSCSAEWMDENYDLEDWEFIECGGRNLNNIINAIADVLHTAYQAGVNGLEYEWYAYNWEMYSEWTGPEGKFDEPQAQSIEEPAGPDEPVEEPGEEKPRGLAGVVFQPEPTVEPAVKAPTSNMGLWPLIIALAVIAIILLMTLLRMKGSKPKKPKTDKKTIVKRRASNVRRTRKRR